jgi:nitrite reductase/ring-hydroxylating ferredoxin subunit
MTDLLKRKLTRRTLLRVGGCAGISMAACGVSAAVVGTQTDLFDRLRGITDMPLLENDDAWRYEGGVLVLDLALVPELAAPDSAVRLEEDAVPEPLLIVRDAQDVYHVFVNKCTHADRKLDLVDGELECTSFSTSTFDLAGEPQSGPAKDRLTTYTAGVDGGRLVVALA